MSRHRAKIVWAAEGDVAAGTYSRAHEWRFDGGTAVPASASPQVVPPPHAREDAVDPEEAFVAAIASCHMLWFLDLARRAGFAAESYRDTAEGQMRRGADGRMRIARVDLYPQTAWQGAAPDAAALEALHHQAHEACFIANSVTTEIVTHIAGRQED